MTVFLIGVLVGSSLTFAALFVLQELAERRHRNSLCDQRRHSWFRQTPESEHVVHGKARW